MHTGTTDQDIDVGIFIRQRLSNMIPPPSEGTGLFTDNWPRNITRLIHRVGTRAHVEKHGPVG